MTSNATFDDLEEPSREIRVAWQTRLSALGKEHWYLAEIEAFSHWIDASSVTPSMRKMVEDAIVWHRDGIGDTKQLGQLYETTFLEDQNFLNECTDSFKQSYAHAAAVAIGRNAVFPSVPYLEGEGDAEPDDWDVSFYVSLYVSGGATWEDVEIDRVSRGRFWRWYESEVERRCSGMK